MAKTINLAEKYSKQVQERFYEDSYTQSMFSKDLDAEFVGVKTVRVYEVDTAPMNDYTRSGTSRYGTPKELNDNIYEFQMKKDRSFTFTIDKGNQAEQMNIKEAGKCLRRQMREKVTPEIDEYRMKVWAEQAGQHVALTAAPSKATIVEQLMDANVALDKLHVPKKNRTFVIDISYYKYLKLASEWIGIDVLGRKSLEQGVIGTFDGTPVKAIATMPSNVYFMLILKNAAISPMKLKDYKIHTNVPGISGNLVEGRVMYDAFVKPTMAAGIYVACANGTVCTKPTISITSNTITLTAGTGETIKYTLDGSDPRFSETAATYDSSSKPSAEAGDVVRAAATKTGMFWSDLAEATN
jgi:hypothetical protein